MSLTAGLLRSTTRHHQAAEALDAVVCQGSSTVVCKGSSFTPHAPFKTRMPCCPSQPAASSDELCHVHRHLIYLRLHWAAHKHSEADRHAGR